MNGYFEKILDIGIKENDLKNKLEKLETWGKGFWTIDSQKTAAIFAQRGYEDKGCGHINRIISNVLDLLEKYHGVLIELNQGKNMDAFFEHLKPTLIMFFIAAQVHDIGMNLAGMFEALKGQVAAGGDSALHISEIIHNYHHYAGFIVFLEITNHNAGSIISDSDLFPYLSNIPGKQKKMIKNLIDLKGLLKRIYEDHFKLYFNEHIKNENEFCVILAILCLLHKEINEDYVQSILRRFKSDDHQDMRKYFDKWRRFFDQAGEWTEKTGQGAAGSHNIDKRLDDGKQFLLMPGNQSDNHGILDLLLVEALLQYGDKTDITIARLTNESVDSDDKRIIPLERFIEDTKFDNDKGFLCIDMAQKIISSFARFRACRFIPVISVEVLGDKINNEGKLEIIIHYTRFEHDDEVFRILRYHNEKDFYELGFLDVIKIHIPMLIYHSKSQNAKKITNPIFDIDFTKKEHRLLSLEKELESVLLHFMKEANNRKNYVTIKVDPEKPEKGRFISEPKNLFVDFFKTEKMREIMKRDQNSYDKENMLEEISVPILRTEFDNYKKNLVMGLIAKEKNNEESEKYILNNELQEILDQFIEHLELLKKSTQNKNGSGSPASYYIGIKIKLVQFLIKLKSPQNSPLEWLFFADKDDNLKERIKESLETREGIQILRERIYEESQGNIDSKDRFPYTQQNREAIYRSSRAILDPEEKKKTEGIKKVFYQTGDLIVPSSFEIMAVLNLFYEER